MASSKNSKTEKKAEVAESSKTASKAPKPRKEKHSEKKKKSNKKKKLVNCDVKEDEAIIVPSSSIESHEEEEEEQEEGREEDKTEITNGRTSGTKSKSGKAKGMKDDDENEDEAEGNEDAKGNVFPMNRIRTIIRGQNLDLRVSQEAIFVINKATEKFLEQFTREAHAACARDRKKSLAYKHLSSVVSKQSIYDFLSDFVPVKLKAEDALRERNSGTTGD